ncbi:MAG: carboxypeptidase regulatory-like domain-containing protein, partial [Chloroflexi bacterium]|nr:carboxypeptidase regulatory-like domain-containing protein [Chloroflexota bacterium]
NGAGGAVEESSDPATGVFRLRVGGGQWLLDVKPGATSSFLGDVTQRDRWVATVSSGQTAAADVNVEPLMGDLSGVTRKPNGQPLGGATVLIRRQIVSKNPAPVATVVSDAAGRYSVRLPLGDYEVTASASESVATSASGLDVGATQVGRPSLGPSLRKIQLRSGQPNVAIDLPFRSADATISGTVNLPTPGEALVRAYSSSGAHTSVRTVGGRFELPVTPDDTWTVDAVAEQGTTSPEVFRAPPKSVDVRGPASVGVSLGLVSDGQLPPSFNWRFDPTQPRNFKLGDGAEIIIPEGAIEPNAACADKTLVLSANVRVERPQQQSLQLIGKSYEVTARDCFGPVASPFLKPVRIRLPLSERAGTAIQPTTDVGGLQAGTRHRVMLPFIAKTFTGSPVTSAADLVPGYYSPLAKSWLPLVRSGERWAGKGGAGGSALLGAFEIEVDHFTEWSILATGGGA